MTEIEQREREMLFDACRYCGVEVPPGYAQPLRAFTASVDAAMSLVPEGFSFDLSTNYTDPLAIIWTEDDADDCSHAHADTPALALCAAALRARATLEDNRDPR